MTYTIIGSLFATLVSQLGSKLFSSSPASLHGFWSMFNDLQMYQTFLLMGIYVPEELIIFYTDLSFAIFTFTFLEGWGIPNPVNLLKGLELTQEKAIYKRIGLKSGSLYVNEAYLFTFLIITLILDIVISPLLCFLRRRKSKKLQKVALKISKFLHLRFYIRTALE